MPLPTKKTNKKISFGQSKSLLYGLPKTGKTQLASQIPEAIFAATENGLSHVEVFAEKITSWQDLLALCKSLLEEKHEFKTLVIDTVDLAYGLCEEFICKREGVKEIGDIPYGGGWKMARREFLRVFNKINLDLGIGILFISHSKQREVKKKTAQYTMMDTSLPPSAGDEICGFVDYIFYGYIDDDGKRIIRTKPTKYINAGDRSGLLPELIEFSYQSLSEAFENHLNKKEEKKEGVKNGKPK